MAETARLTQKGLRTRERIIDAAGELFLTQGMAATTLDDVKAAAGVSSSQLYHYFESKGDLVLRDWARFVVDNFRSFDCCGGCPLGSLGGEAAEYEERARQAISASLRRWEGVLREALTQLADSGQLGLGADPGALAIVLVVALEGGLLLGKIHRSSRPLEVALAHAIDHIASFSAPARPSWAAEMVSN
ncbi:TetR/AcrR family transcriptional regulator [Acidiferrimicrobium sp. IK]|uniref:TetR/AcrR family transcriptional regulator n=1 Tax=Acidiferrimicrobium sp. IK TaxID=2871700 RepID=UPI0021CAF102|nr:TetR/AcrR family transcriptional regulator [Acidiferrimicrobium sp. IK]MCU4186699.1 TetR/AcrR family transcriptional regulator [Acidiferrimicrobium sp. IK]